MTATISYREKSRELTVFIPVGTKGKMIVSHGVKNSDLRYHNCGDDKYLLFLRKKDFPNIEIFDEIRPGGPYH
jgi:hypothetical protein